MTNTVVETFMKRKNTLTAFAGRDSFILSLFFEVTIPSIQLENSMKLYMNFRKEAISFIQQSSLALVMILDHHACHGFDHGHDAGANAWIMPADRRNLPFVAVHINGSLW